MRGALVVCQDWLRDADRGLRTLVLEPQSGHAATHLGCVQLEEWEETEDVSGKRKFGNEGEGKEKGMEEMKSDIRETEGRERKEKTNAREWERKGGKGE